MTVLTFIFLFSSNGKIDASAVRSAIPPVVTSSKPISSAAERAVDISEAPPEPVVPVDIFYDFSATVPEAAAVSYDYFNDTVFIGDSRTQGLIFYTKIKPFNFSAQSANISTIQTKAYITLVNDEGKNCNYTLAEALELKNGSYKAIYISTGVNELGWSASRFIDSYKTLIESIRSITDVPIYIQLIMPLTSEFSESGSLTNAKAAEFNKKLRALADEYSLFLLDPTAIHTLDDGTLDPAHTFDGAHLYPASYAEVADYYRTHVVDVNAYTDTREMYCPDESEK